MHIVHDKINYHLFSFGVKCEQIYSFKTTNSGSVKL